MTDLALSASTLEQLKEKHISFLEARLTADIARDDLVQSLADGYAWLLDLPLRDVVDPVALTDGLIAALTTASVKELFAPIVRDTHRRTVDSLRRDATRVGDYVDAAARLAIDDL